MADLQLQISALCFLPGARVLPAQGGCVPCSVPHNLGAGRDAREDGFCFVGTCSVLPCCELARHGNMRFCKAETLRRKTHTQIAPGRAAGGACLESISSPGRVCCTLAVTLSSGEGRMGACCRWAGGQDGHGCPHVCSQKLTSAEMSAGTESPLGAKWHRGGCAE